MEQRRGRVASWCWVGLCAWTMAGCGHRAPDESAGAPSLEVGTVRSAAVSAARDTFVVPTSHYLNLGLRAMAMKAGTAIVGAPLALDSKDKLVGAAYVYGYSNGAWTVQQELGPGDLKGDFSHFGNAVAYDGDTAVIGGRTEDQNSGRVYVFARSGSTFALSQKLTASDAAPNTYFGDKVAVSGDTIAALTAAESPVGFPVGVVYVFTRSGASFTETQRIAVPDPIESAPTPFTLALNGDTLLLGVPDQTLNGIRSGVVYAFHRSGSNWALATRIVPSAPATAQRFGSSIATNGGRVAIGAPLEGQDGTGAVYVFDRSGDGYTQSQHFRKPGTELGAYFGAEVAISEGFLLIGQEAWTNPNTFQTTGAAWAYARGPSGFGKGVRLLDDPVEDQAYFGAGLALDGAHALVAAPYARVDGNNPIGRVSAFSLDLVQYGLGAACEDDSDCVGNHCVDGVCCDTACGGNSPVDCMACSVARGATQDGTCAPVADGAACDDGNACTTVDACQNATCVGGTPKTCPAPNECQVETCCQPSTGECRFVTKPDGIGCSYGVCTWGLCGPPRQAPAQEFAGVAPPPSHGYRPVAVAMSEGFAESMHPGANYTYHHESGGWVRTAGAGYYFAPPNQGTPDFVERVAVGISASGLLVGASTSDEAWYSSLIPYSGYPAWYNDGRDVIELVPSDPEYAFGRSVALDHNQAVLIGTANDGFGTWSTTARYLVHDQKITWNEVATIVSRGPGLYELQAASLSGDRLAIGSENGVLIYERASSTWTLAANLTSPAPTTERPTIWYGDALSIAGDVLVVGAPTTPEGEAYVYSRSAGGTWAYAQTLARTHGVAGDRMGSAVATNGTIILVSAPGASSVLQFERRGGTWVETRNLGRPTPTPDLGLRVAFEGDQAIVISARDTFFYTVTSDPNVAPIPWDGTPRPTACGTLDPSDGGPDPSDAGPDGGAGGSVNTGAGGAVGSASGGAGSIDAPDASEGTGGGTGGSGGVPSSGGASTSGGRASTGGAHDNRGGAVPDGGDLDAGAIPELSKTSSSGCSCSLSDGNLHEGRRRAAIASAMAALGLAMTRRRRSRRTE